MFNSLNVQLLLSSWATATSWLRITPGLVPTAALLGEGWFLPFQPTRTAQQPSDTISLHGGFACLPSFCSSFTLPLSLSLHFATTSIEKDSWKQIGQVSLLVCLESWNGGKVVPVSGSVSPRHIYISLSEGETVTREAMVDLSQKPAENKGRCEPWNNKKKAERSNAFLSLSQVCCECTESAGWWWSVVAQWGLQWQWIAEVERVKDLPSAGFAAVRPQQGAVPGDQARLRIPSWQHSRTDATFCRVVLESSLISAQNPFVRIHLWEWMITVSGWSQHQINVGQMNVLDI